MNKYDWSDLWVFMGLIGLAYGITRAFEGYPAIELVSLVPVGWLVWRLVQIYPKARKKTYSEALYEAWQHIQSLEEEKVCVQCGHPRRNHLLDQPGCLSCNDESHWFSDRPE